MSIEGFGLVFFFLLNNPFLWSLMLTSEVNSYFTCLWKALSTTCQDSLFGFLPHPGFVAVLELHWSETAVMWKGCQLCFCCAWHVKTHWVQMLVCLLVTKDSHPCGSVAENVLLHSCCAFPVPCALKPLTCWDLVQELITTVFWLRYEVLCIRKVPVICGSIQHIACLYL